MSCRLPTSRSRPRRSLLATSYTQTADEPPWPRGSLVRDGCRAESNPIRGFASAGSRSRPVGSAEFDPADSGAESASGIHSHFNGNHAGADGSADRGMTTATSKQAVAITPTLGPTAQHTAQTQLPRNVAYNAAVRRHRPSIRAGSAPLQNQINRAQSSNSAAPAAACSSADEQTPRASAGSMGEAACRCWRAHRF